MEIDFSIWLGLLSLGIIGVGLFFVYHLRVFYKDQKTLRADRDISHFILSHLQEA